MPGICRTKLSVISLLVALGQATAQTAPVEWRFYGGDQGGGRYSSLKQVNRTNVAGLQRAWTYHTGELEIGLRSASF